MQWGFFFAARRRVISRILLRLATHDGHLSKRHSGYLRIRHGLAPE